MRTHKVSVSELMVAMDPLKDLQKKVVFQSLLKYTKIINLVPNYTENVSKSTSKWNLEAILTHVCDTLIL